ncbi:hypothetical protein BD779DRAFT_571743 [Infundibulicybe gibba]|nr:hypothetical protein BD779DRAFT_571743 [Infundibulicybe gibba]
MLANTASSLNRSLISPTTSISPHNLIRLYFLIHTSSHNIPLQPYAQSNQLLPPAARPPRIRAMRHIPVPYTAPHPALVSQPSIPHSYKFTIFGWGHPSPNSCRSSTRSWFKPAGFLSAAISLPAASAGVWLQSKDQAASHSTIGGRCPGRGARKRGQPRNTGRC